jgi:hypothetical protein
MTDDARSGALAYRAWKTRGSMDIRTAEAAEIAEGIGGFDETMSARTRLSEMKNLEVAREYHVPFKGTTPDEPAHRRNDAARARRHSNF